MFELKCGEPQRSDVTTASKRRGGERGLCEDWTERERYWVEFLQHFHPAHKFRFISVCDISGGS